jgi:hypothetical protein
LFVEITSIKVPKTLATILGRIDRMHFEGIEQSNTETLRLILERKQNRAVTYDEALDIGDSLLDAC